MHQWGARHGYDGLLSIHHLARHRSKCIRGLKRIETNHGWHATHEKFGKVRHRIHDALRHTGRTTGVEHINFVAYGVCPRSTRGL